MYQTQSDDGKRLYPAADETQGAHDSTEAPLHRHCRVLADVYLEINIAASNLRENPHIAAAHFHHRFTTFLRDVLIKKLTDTAAARRVSPQTRAGPTGDE